MPSQGPVKIVGLMGQAADQIEDLVVGDPFGGIDLNYKFCRSI
jgi:hypothetical protein